MLPEMEITARIENTNLTVGLLVACAGTRAAELLGLGPAGVGDEERPVVAEQDVFDFFLRCLIDVCGTQDEEERNGGQRVGVSGM